MKLFYFFFLPCSLLSLSLRWPTEKTPAAKKLPSLEVRVAPPQEYQPKVQAEIKLLEEQRETMEYKAMENLEKKYNEELVNAGKKIKETIDKSLKLFDDPMLLTRSIEYAMSPPILPKFGGIGKAEFFFKEKNSKVEVKEKNEDKLSSDLVEGEKSFATSPSQESTDLNAISADVITNSTVGEMQRETRNALLNEDKISKIFKVQDFVAKKEEGGREENEEKKEERKGEETKSKEEEGGKKEVDRESKNEEGKREEENMKDVAVAEKKEEEQEKSKKEENKEEGKGRLKKVSFLQSKMKVMQGPAGGAKDDGVPLPPILVKVFDAKEPEQKVQTEMDNLEKERADAEKKMFTKAEMELKLITLQTIQELALNLESEMMPFFVASKNVLGNINSAIAGKMDSLKMMRFLQRSYPSDMEKYFPLHFKQIQKLQKLDNQTNNFDVSSDNETNNKENNKETVSTLKPEQNLEFKQESEEINEIGKNNLMEQSRFKEKEDYQNSFTMDELMCQDLLRKYKFLDFGCNKAPAVTTVFLELKNYLSSKQAGGGGGADNVNVKVGASEVPYPTIYRLIYEMETRRDLAEKWERLKILEFEMNLQKAEDEMIKDALHQGIQKVIAKFGPAIEGAQENIR